MVGGLLVAGTALVSIDLALVTASVLYAHVLSDLAWDVRAARQRPNRSG